MYVSLFTECWGYQNILNAFDQYLERDFVFVMVHGDDCDIPGTCLGCYFLKEVVFI